MKICCSSLNVAETECERFQSQVTPIQNRGTFPWTATSETWHRLISSPMGELESVTFQLHARMLSSLVAQSLKSNVHFWILSSRMLPVTAMLKNADFPA